MDMIEPEAAAALDAAYKFLGRVLNRMLDAGHHPRAIIGAMGRLYMEASKVTLSPDECHQLADVITEHLKR